MLEMFEEMLDVETHAEDVHEIGEIVSEYER